MCRSLIRRNDKPLKLFINAGNADAGSTPNMHSPPQRATDIQASYKALREKYEDFKSSSRAQVKDLESRNVSLSDRISRLESELSSDYHKSLASLREFRATTKKLTSATDSAWSEVNRLKEENARLSRQVEELNWHKQRTNTLSEWLEGALERSVKTTRNQTKRLRDEKLCAQKRTKNEPDNRRIPDGTKKWQVSQRWKEAEQAARTQVAEMHNQIWAARRVYDLGLRPSNSDLIDALARVRSRFPLGC